MLLNIQIMQYNSWDKFINLNLYDLKIYLFVKFII